MNAAPLLDPRVARKKFSQSVKELQAAELSYERIWKIRKIEFPIILINILSSAGKPALILYLNLRNYDFLPPSVTILGLDYSLYPRERLPIARDPEDGMEHIWSNGSEAWFCSPGFYEYHFLYREDPWELVRGTAHGKIVTIVERACNLLDRGRL